MKREHIYIGNTKTLMRIDKEGLEADPYQIDNTLLYSQLSLLTFMYIRKDM